MTEVPLLSMLIFLPLFGALFIFFMAAQAEDKSKVDKNARHMALFVTMVTFILSLVVWQKFDSSGGEYQFVEGIDWLGGYGITYFLGIDGISLYLILLTTLLFPICILVSKQITERVPEYFACFLIMETLIIGVFCALDLLLFYFFFEATLIPMFIIIGVWGGQNRIYASFKFFLYTLLGSLFFLLAIIFMYIETGTTSIPELTRLVPEWPLHIQCWLWAALFASFAVKLPMWPVHTWLPDAHVQAPTAGSVILAGVLLKLGGYGMMRLSLPVLPDASIYFADFVFILSIIAVVYTSLIALMQEDMKKLIAYSSVAHMGFVTIGLFSFNEQGIQGAYFQMISHGIISAALFMCVGVLYDRMHTKEIIKYGGVVDSMPRFAAIFMLFMLASVGLPGTSGFVGEFLVIVGAFKAATYVSVLAATSLILGAAYMLWLYRRVIFGEVKNKTIAKLSDIESHETLAFIPLVFLVLLAGIYPSFITAAAEPAITSIVQILAVPWGG